MSSGNEPERSAAGSEPGDVRRVVGGLRQLMQRRARFALAGVAGLTLASGVGVGAAAASPPVKAGPAPAAAPALSALAFGPGATQLLPHPPAPDPLAADAYLAEERAGYGSPAQATRRLQQAMAQARTIRARTSAERPIPGPVGVAPASPSLSDPWVPIGPTPITNSYYGSTNSGRVDSLAVVPSGPHAGEIFEGSAGGGVWSSTDNGQSWQSHTDQAATGLAIGALAIDPGSLGNAAGVTVYAGTGEANGCGDCFYGQGVLKSTDGGNTWTQENPGGIFTGADFTSIAVDPNNSNDIWAGTTQGLYVSTDGGANWSHPAGDTSTHAAYGLQLDPNTTPTTVYIGTEGVGLQKSTDGGTTPFTTLGTTGTTTLPAAANFGVLALGIGTKTATHPSGDQTLYAAVQLNGTTDTNGGDVSMYKSTDGGTNWTQLTIPAYTDGTYAYGSGQDQASYDTAIAVDPSDPNDVLAAGEALVQSTDGGTSWSNVNGGCFFVNSCGITANVLHPDFHALTFASGSRALIGNDGGVYEYTNPVTSGNPTGPSGITSLNTNQSTLQFYPDLALQGTSAGTILGGLQDNGTGLYSAGSTAWTDVNSGDGGYNLINPNDPSQQFGEADSGLYMTSDGWNSNTSITTTTQTTRAEFIDPLALIPNNATPDKPEVFYGGADLWMTSDPTAATVSWSQLTNEGSGVTAIGWTPSHPADMYVGFSDGSIEVSTNANTATPTFSDISPATKVGWVTHIDVNPSNAGQIAIGYSASGSLTQTGASNADIETGSVTLTGTPSATYTNVTGNLPTGVASNSVVYDGTALVAATDVGVFSTPTSGLGGTVSWSSVGTGLPNVQVMGLTVDSSGDLFAATHGRGAWELPASALPAPSVTSLGTTSGNAGTSVTINGTNFAGVSAVKFGSVAASSFTVNSVDQITATAPANSPGTADVSVTSSSGTSATSTADRFTYPGPVVTGVSPGSGSTAGGTSVTITGTGFTGATAVGFGGTPAASYTVVSDSQITATSPAAPAGTVDVTVTTPVATSGTGAADRFAYQTPATTSTGTTPTPPTGTTPTATTSTTGTTATGGGTPTQTRLATVQAARAAGTVAQLRLTCSAGQGACRVTVRLTIRERVRKRVHGRYKWVTKTVTVGSLTRTLAGGSGLVKVGLNGLGKRLLAREGSLHVLVLAQAGHTRVSRRAVVFHKPKKHRR